MKIAVLGASGLTGNLIMEQALEAGHEVTAVVRTPSKITTRSEKLHIVKADVFSSEELTEAFKEHDAVLSALGFTATNRSQNGYTESMKAIVPAMRAASVPRLIVMTSMCTDCVAPGRGFLINWIFIPFIKPVLMNMNQMEKWLKAEVGDINWTVVRPGGLNKKPKLDEVPLQQKDGQSVEDPAAAMAIPRANVAAFMLSQLSDDTYTREIVAIAVKK